MFAPFGSASFAGWPAMGAAGSNAVTPEASTTAPNSAAPALSVGALTVTPDGSATAVNSAAPVVAGVAYLPLSDYELVVDGGTVAASRSDVTVDVLEDSPTGPRAVVFSDDSLTTDSNGALANISGAEFTTGEAYRVVFGIEATVAGEARPLGVLRVVAE
jgi:hypothetical protein